MNSATLQCAIQIIENPGGSVKYNLLQGKWPIDIICYAVVWVLGGVQDTGVTTAEVCGQNAHGGLTLHRLYCRKIDTHTLHYLLPL